MFSSACQVQRCSAHVLEHDRLQTQSSMFSLAVHLQFGLSLFVSLRSFSQQQISLQDNDWMHPSPIKQQVSLIKVVASHFCLQRPSDMPRLFKVIETFVLSDDATPDDLVAAIQISAEIPFSLHWKGGLSEDKPFKMVQLNRETGLEAEEKMQKLKRQQSQRKRLRSLKSQLTRCIRQNSLR